MSKWADDTKEGSTGKSVPHGVAFITFLVLSIRNLPSFPAKALWRVEGGWKASNVSLRTWVPISTISRHRRMKFVVSLVNKNVGAAEAMDSC